MPIIVSPEADKTFVHPLVRTHPVTGRKALFVSPVYTVGIEGMAPNDADPLLGELCQHMVQDGFVYRHHWSEGMVVIWDNRCTMHNAAGRLRRPPAGHAPHDGGGGATGLAATHFLLPCGRRCRPQGDG